MDDVNFASASADRARASIEALLDDQSGCWRRGERLPAEVFLDRRPGLRRDSNAVLDLIYHEILLRCRLGERPTPEEYARRFPQVAEQLRAHFEVHEALLGACEKMGTGTGRTSKISSFCEARPEPVPIFSQPLRACERIKTVVIGRQRLARVGPWR
jgi:hypothetical protein